MEGFTLIAKLILNRDEFDSGLAAVESDMGSDSKMSGFKQIGAKIGRIAAQAATAAFNAVADFGRSALETGMSFDAMMSQVKAVTGMTEDEFDSVRKRAIELGESTEWTAEQVGQAFYYMGLAGWKSGEMLDGIEPILSLASASGEDLGQTADIVTDALTAMGYQAKDAAQFANVLAAAASNSNTTVGMMGEAFKYLATTGGVLGYTIEDVATTLGLLANNGIKAGQAGTSMRQILNTLVNPSNAAAKAMDQLGITLFSFTTGERLPLMDVVEQFRTVFKEADFDLQGKSVEEFQEKLDKANADYDRWMTEIKEKGYAVGGYDEKGNEVHYTEDEVNAMYTRMLRDITGFNADFLAKLGDIGGLRGISSLFALMKSTDEDVNQLQNAVNSSSEGKGAAKTMAETMLDNLKGDITLLNSALDGLKILVSDEYKGYIRDFIQIITGGIGEISAAFKKDGLSGMFTNLVDWVINGMTDVLTNPEITVDGARNFGKALGDFVGHVVSTLVKNAPELLSGLFLAGTSLAGGLIEGLFSGLFGTCSDSVYGFMSQAEQEQDKIIADANGTAAQAQGIVNYMDTLVQKYGEAAKESDEWATAMGKLESLIPGITQSIKNEGEELSTTTANFREYIEQHKQKAIEDARKAYLADITGRYEETQVALGKAEVNREIARYEQEEAMRQMAEMYLNLRNELLQDSELSADWVNQQGLGAEYNDAESIIKALQEGRLQIKDLQDAFLGYQSADDQKMMETLKRKVEEAGREYDKQTEEIDKLTTAASELNVQMGVAQKAVERMVQKMDSFEVPSVGGYGQAKGDWYVPYDNYPSLLHRGEMVLTASQARRYREGDSNVNTEAFAAAVVSAIRQGMENAQVNAYMDGRKVSEEVSRNMNNLLMEGRYA